MKRMKIHVWTVALATVFALGVRAAMTDELGLSPYYWYKYVSGQRSYGTADVNNVPLVSLGSPNNTKSSACLALASGGPGVITMSGCGGNAGHADLLTTSVPDASTAFFIIANID